jgi:hypothetical protein
MRRVGFLKERGRSSADLPDFTDEAKTIKTSVDI